MKSGYDQFFKEAQKAATQGKTSRPVNARPVKNSVQTQDAKELARQLRQRMKPKLQKKAKKKLPWKLAGVSFIGMVIAAAGLWRMDEVEKLARRVEFSLLGKAYAEESAVKPSQPVAANDKAQKAAAAAKDAEATPPVAKKEYTDEEINHFAKLNERKKELDAREEELNRMEQELQVQKAELEKRLADLETTRRNISSVLEEKVQTDDKKVENLVQMYSNMKPQQAAKAFEEMDEGLAIEILGRMKKKNAAEIMNLVKSEKVKNLSEKYAGYKRN